MTQISDLVSLRSVWLEGQRPVFRFFWGLPRDLEVMGPWVFSQWYPAPFTSDGVLYATAEHWMMAAKARMAGDHDTLTLIVEDSLKPHPDPGLAKRWGRMVAGFDPAEWDRRKCDVVFGGNMLKFGSHPKLKEYLLSTGEEVLVEASPGDRIWGIGFKKDAPEASNPMKWTGQNLLGFVLMDVRRRMRSES